MSKGLVIFCFSHIEKKMVWMKYIYMYAIYKRYACDTFAQRCSIFHPFERLMLIYRSSFGQCYSSKIVPVIVQWRGEGKTTTRERLSPINHRNMIYSISDTSLPMRLNTQCIVSFKTRLCPVVANRHNGLQACTHTHTHATFCHNDLYKLK